MNKVGEAAGTGEEGWKMYGMVVVEVKTNKV